MIRRERRPINPEALQRIRDFLEVGLDDEDEAFLKHVEDDDTESSSSASESSVTSSDESASDQHSEAEKEDKDNEKQKTARKAKAEAKRKEQAALREKKKLEREERKRRRAEVKEDSDSDRSVGSDDFGPNAGHDSSASDFTCSERDSEISSDDEDFGGKSGNKEKSKKTGGTKKDKVSRAEREARRATREEERKEKKKLVGGGSGSGGKEDSNKTTKAHQRNGTKKQQPSEAEIRAHNMMKRHAGAEAMAKLEGQAAKEFSQSARMKRASLREIESTNALRDMENRYAVDGRGGDEDGEGGGISGLAGGVVVGKGSKGSGRKRGAASGGTASSESSRLTRLNTATTPAFNTHVLAPIALSEGIGVPSLLTQLEKQKTQSLHAVGSSPDLKRRRIDKEGVSDGVNSDPTRENNNNNKTGSSFAFTSSAAVVSSQGYDDPFIALKDKLIMLTYNVTPTQQHQHQQQQAAAQSGGSFSTSNVLSSSSSSMSCTDGVSGLSTSFAIPSTSAASASVACVKDILRRPSVRSFAHLEALERYEAWEETVEADKKLNSGKGRIASPATGVKMLMMKVGGLSVDVLNALGQKNGFNNSNETVTTSTGADIANVISNDNNNTVNNNNCSFHNYEEFYGEDDENYNNFNNKNRIGSDSDDDDTVKDGGDEDYAHGGGAALCSRGGNVATYLSGLGGHSSSSSSLAFSRLKFKSIFGEEGALSVEAFSTCIQQQLRGGEENFSFSCLPTLYPSPQHDGNSYNKSSGLVGGTIATRQFTPALFVNPNVSENMYPLFQAHELASVL